LLGSRITNNVLVIDGGKFYIGQFSLFNLQILPPSITRTLFIILLQAKDAIDSLDQIDPELRRTFEKLGISLDEQKRLSGVAVDAVIDSVSIGTSFKAQLAELGIIFCSMSEAIQEHPELIQKYLSSVVPVTDNYYAALNAAVFSDGSFCYIPAGVRCPMELLPISASMQKIQASLKEH